tara:strand:+ start:1366 stop:1671 length:306 start_codon:yes stop_codon:yes gene_type:complete
MSENKTPGIWAMAKSFSKDLAKYVAEGAPNVSETDYRQRLADCNACVHLVKDKMRCGKCGCLIQHKAKWKTTTCPIGKWKTQVLDNGEVKEGDNTDSSNEA